MNKIILNLIALAHILLILFVVGVPIFSNDVILLITHLWIVPFILLHWCFNDNNCAVATIEKKLREKVYGKDHDIYHEDCVTCKLVEPVYDFNKTMEKHGLHDALCIITVLLWLLSVVRVNNKYKNGEIHNVIEETRRIVLQNR